MITYRYRIKNPGTLPELAQAVNLVWNFCAETQRRAQGWGRRWPTTFDLNRLLAGSSRAGLPVGSVVFEAVAARFAQARDTHRRSPRWRTSLGSRRSLGWVPFRAACRAIQVHGDTVVFHKRRYRLWYHRPVEGEIRCGCFVEDSRGRWYLCLDCEVPENLGTCGNGVTALDLGLMSLATCSDGTRIENGRHYAQFELALATAQRAGRRDRVRALHAKIKARRRHDLHVATRKIVRHNRFIVVGDVNVGAKKSTLDAAWSTFRCMLRYKARRHGARYVEVSEAWSTQLCSECGALGGPQGIAGLGVREWQCRCGARHDRDVNAARNLLGFALSGQSTDLQLTESRRF